ncbi:hypothetical protein [Trinickia diaoshuihuensis]|uniref:hypothetical protein n=1 Tax=Trinickia diaoshuihuensis TaxID=2292265 RepID=UPI000E22583B|nr:hypothetical protein [Trinickia diaoshuihuensis]
MSPISPLDRLFQTIQSQSVPAAQTKTAVAKSRQEPIGDAGAAKRERLGARLAQRIQAIDRDHPQKRRQAFRLYIEYGLIGRLGEEAASDANFPTLVDQIIRTMEQMESIRDDIDAAADTLLECAANGKSLVTLLDAFERA